MKHLQSIVDMYLRNMSTKFIRYEFYVIRKSIYFLLLLQVLATVYATITAPKNIATTTGLSIRIPPHFLFNCKFNLMIP